MLNVVFYFQVHQPYRLRHVNVLDIGKNTDLFDDQLNRQVMQKVAQKCYLPTNQLLLSLIQKLEGRFRIAYSITGTAIEQFKAYSPETLDSFKALADTGCVEFLGETYVPVPGRDLLPFPGLFVRHERVPGPGGDAPGADEKRVRPLHGNLPQH